MLDSFEILTTSGVVLWSKSYTPAKSSLVNGFIKDVFIEETAPGGNLTNDGTAAENPSYKKNQYTLRWTSVKDLGLIFVVCLPHVVEKVKGADSISRPSTNLYYTSHGLTSYWTTYESYLRTCMVIS